MRTGMRVAAALAGIAAWGCTDQGNPTGVSAPRFSVARSPVVFTIGPLGLNGIFFAFPGGNLHFRDALLAGAVTGGLPGTASMVLSADLDAAGSGPTFGTLAITTTSGDQWQGNVTGHFQGDLPTGILLSSQVVLHGPGQQLFTGDCNEIPPSSSETLACSGEIQNPGN